MVLPPIGDIGGGAALPVGPPPPELQPRFRVIRACLITLTSSLLVKLLSFWVLLPSALAEQVLSSLTSIFLTIIGIFLLKDDALFAPAYTCMVRTFCVSCADQCPGGVTCLCTWFFCCTITAFFNLLPFRDSDIFVIVTFVKILVDPSAQPDLKWWPQVRSVQWYIGCIVFTLSSILALLAQVMGAYQGYKGVQQHSVMGAMEDIERLDGPGGANWPAPTGANWPVPTPATPPRQFAPPAPSGVAGGAGAARRPQGCPGFQPFAGQGQRLSDAVPPEQ